jgi:precorrin-6B C5,15-methyltransferase / cobalt-precorrin-6B C5,C15-methyltransferase
MTGALLTIVGMVGGETFGRAARRAVAEADVLVASPRHLEHIAVVERQRRIALSGPLPPLLDEIDELTAAAHSVCVVASGDPGFFGITRLLAQRFGPDHVTVHPAPSSISLAFATAGLSWDDATIVSAHGRAIDEAIDTLMTARKAAVLTSPTNTPALVGKHLIHAGCEPRRVVVASRLGEPGERVSHTDLDGLAAGDFDPMSVVILSADEPASDGPVIAWGRDESEFGHRSGMITKSEVRAVALAKLGLPRRGVMWDVGAGSGSIAIEAALLAPPLRVIAVERQAEDAAIIAANADRHAATVEVVVGNAPAALADLPDPDRVFVGGGGPTVVRACWDRLRAGGILVATAVVLEHAVAYHRLLGDMVQLHVDRAVPIGNAGVRLRPLNPVFISWGRR